MELALCNRLFLRYTVRILKVYVSNIVLWEGSIC